MNQGQYVSVITPFCQFQLSFTVFTTWLVMLLLLALSCLVTRRLQEKPGKLQAAAEAVIYTFAAAIQAVIPDNWQVVFPFIASLWLFVLAANLLGIVPGLHSPTADLSLTSALAVLVFLSVHWFGIKSEGLRSYLHHYLTPTPIMLPFHIISEISRTIALAVRLFGNMMSLEMAAMMILLVAGFLVPVPILMLHIVEALVQAYIFGMLALIFIASGIESQKLTKEKVIGT